jgi:hypothetical protein
MMPCQGTLPSSARSESVLRRVRDSLVCCNQRNESGTPRSRSSDPVGACGDSQR